MATSMALSGPRRLSRRAALRSLQDGADERPEAGSSEPSAA